jgi:hypothetical protein
LLAIECLDLLIRAMTINLYNTPITPQTCDRSVLSDFFVDKRLSHDDLKQGLAALLPLKPEDIFIYEGDDFWLNYGDLTSPLIIRYIPIAGEFLLRIELYPENSNIINLIEDYGQPIYTFLRFFSKHFQCRCVVGAWDRQRVEDEDDFYLIEGDEKLQLVDFESLDDVVKPDPDDPLDYWEMTPFEDEPVEPDYACHFIFKPYQGTDSTQLGMTRSEVRYNINWRIRHLIPWRNDPSHYEDCPESETLETLGLSLNYNTQGRCEGITLSAPAKAELYGVNLLDMNRAQLQRWLRKRDPDYEQQGYLWISHRLGIKFDVPKGKTDKIQKVSLFGMDAYDTHPHLKPWVIQQGIGVDTITFDMTRAEVRAALAPRSENVFSYTSDYKGGDPDFEDGDCYEDLGLYIGYEPNGRGQEVLRSILFDNALNQVMFQGVNVAHFSRDQAMEHLGEKENNCYRSRYYGFEVEFPKTPKANLPESIMVFCEDYYNVIKEVVPETEPTPEDLHQQEIQIDQTRQRMLKIMNKDEDVG